MPLSFHSGSDEVNSLEPRTHHQPGKLQCCQRTKVNLLFPSKSSIFSRRLYPLCFQSSASHPQPTATTLVQSLTSAYYGEIKTPRFSQLATKFPQQPHFTRSKISTVQNPFRP